MITSNVIVEINENLIEEFGGMDSGIRDLNLLESCVASINQEVFGMKLYPTKESKIAFVVFSIIANHIFLDGNKRTGAQVLNIMAYDFDIDLEYEDEELIDLVLLVAQSKVDYHYICDWILKHELH